MYAMERRDAIERILLTHGRVAVVDLADQFGVATETVRRDLDAMERDGLLSRVHGGAVSKERSDVTELPVTERSEQHSEAKLAIAARALEALPAGFRGSIFLDAGTTTAAIASLLSARLASQNSTAEVVTHSVLLAPVLAGASGITLTVIGGRIRGITAAAVGASTVQAISALRPDVAFVGANGLSAEFGLSTPDPDEAAVKAAIVRAARRVVVVADASKLGQELLVRFADLADIDVLVTDAPVAAHLGEALESADVEVWAA